MQQLAGILTTLDGLKPKTQETAELPLGPASGRRNAEFVCRRTIHQTVMNLSFILSEKVELRLTAVDPFLHPHRKL